MTTERSDVATRARRRIAIRLLPFVMLMYLVCLIDRNNVAFANLRMSADLGLADRVYGLGVGMFFIGYVLFEVPGAIIVERWSARKWLARILISWGLVTILNGFIHTAGHFYMVRLLVGIDEASFANGLVVYLTHWFRESDRAKAIGFFLMGGPAASSVGGIIAAWLLRVRWLGIVGWRWLFILEGIPAILLGAVTLFYLTDWPRDAKWLNVDERSWIISTLSYEKEAKQQVRSYTIWEALRHRDVILLTTCYFFAATGNYGIGFWLPSFLKRLSGESDTTVTLLAALPYLAGFLVQQLNGWHSDRTGERRWHAAIPLLLSGFFLFMAIRMGSNVFLSMLFFVGVGGAYFGFHPAFWPVPTEFLTESAAAASIGLINSVGNLGGFVGPFIVGYLLTRTNSFRAGLSFLVGSFLASATLMLLVRARKQDISI